MEAPERALSAHKGSTPTKLATPSAYPALAGNMRTESEPGATTALKERRLTLELVSAPRATIWPATLPRELRMTSASTAGRDSRRTRPLTTAWRVRYLSTRLEELMSVFLALVAVIARLQPQLAWPPPQDIIGAAQRMFNVLLEPSAPLERQIWPVARLAAAMDFTHPLGRRTAPLTRPGRA